MTHQQAGVGILALLMLFLAGCEREGPTLVNVSGMVMYDGQPVEEGEIIFLPADKALAPHAGKIRDGKYSFPATLGENRVEIRAARVVPGRVNDMGPVKLDYIPAQYNSASTLSATIIRDDKNQFDFTLAK